jgi:hypothetical protein
MNDVHQWYGVLVAAGGIGATLCGYGLIAPPKNTSNTALLICKFLGPLGCLLALLEFFGTRT